MLVEIDVPKPAGGQLHRDPSPAEIAAMCLEIQKEWTPAERAWRWQYKPQEWMPLGASGPGARQIDGLYLSC